MMRTIGVVTTFMMVVLVCQTLAGQSQKKIDVTGVWDVKISLPDGTVTGYASLTQTGTKVAGQIGPIKADTMPTDGAVSGDTLTLTLHPQKGRVSAFTTCKVTVTADRLTGTVDDGKSKIEFTRTKGD